MIRTTACLIAALLLWPGAVAAGKFSVSFSYAPKMVAQEEVMPENPLNDYYHRIALLEPQKRYEPERYYVILEGLDQPLQSEERIALRGLTVDRSYVITKMNGDLTFENKDRIPRRFTVVEEGNSVTQELAVPAEGTARYTFMRTGTYTFIDAQNPTAKVFVRVLTACTIYAVRGPMLKIDIPALSAGTYTLKVYYAFQQIYQEDFSVVGDSTLAVDYRIIDREVFRNDSTTFTGGRIISAPGMNRDAAGTAASPAPTTSRDQQ